MNNAAPHSSTAGLGAIEEADLCAALVLDATGKIVASNRSAQQLWSAPDRSLVGFPFIALFASEDVPSDPESIAAHWRALAAATLDRWTRLSTQPRDGTPRAVRVRIERAVGGAGSYIATILLEPNTRAPGEPAKT